MSDLPHGTPARREPLVLFAAALAFFSANMHRLALPPVDDCFYAREGVEMLRRGAFFTVRWDGNVNFAYPALQQWLLSRSFALFGVNDFAARLPGVLMGFCLLLMAWRIGRLVADRAVATLAVALLVISPYFGNNVRRCMIEVPLAFWITLAMLLLLEGRRRPWLHALVALPLGAAVLTKSVLGLLPLPVLALAAALSPAWRAPLRRPWLWLGVLGGLAVGSAWSLWEYAHFGWTAIQQHYFAQVGGYSRRPLGILARVFGYPALALTQFEPAFLPGVYGLVRLAGRGRARLDADLLFLMLWALLPFVLYAVSGTQSQRYIFPTFVPFAVLGAHGLEASLPRLARALRVWVAPAVAAAAALLFWFAPAVLSSLSMQPLKERAAAIEAAVAAGETVPFIGSNYWKYADPLLYYAERRLAPSSAGVPEALAAARSRRSRVLFCGPGRLADVRTAEPRLELLAQSREWAVVRVPPAPR